MFYPAAVLLPHVQAMLELVQRAMSDDEKTESIVKLAMGLVGDLAATYSDGRIKQLLLAEWLAAAFRPNVRVSADTKKTIRWAKEVCTLFFFVSRFIWDAHLVCRWSSVPLLRFSHSFFLLPFSFF